MGRGTVIQKLKAKTRGYQPSKEEKVWKDPGAPERPGERIGEKVGSLENLCSKEPTFPLPPQTQTALKGEK